jgi:spermidine synthase
MDQSWGLSRTYQGPVPEQLGMVVDDTGYTTMYRWEGERTLEFFRANVIALPYALHEKPVTLIIGPGGGKDVLTALAMDAGPVTAVEVNNLIVAAVNEHFAPFTGALYRRPGVTAVVDEGRSYIRRSAEKYDIIQASAVFGRMAPAAGAFTLSENTLYTREAFRDYWDHLTPDGILTISRFIFEREALRLVSLGLDLLQRQGVRDPAAHIAVIKERGLANFMLKRSPFTPAEVAQLRRLAAEREFEVVFLPDRREQAEGVFGKLINSGGSAGFYRTFPFDITPTSDDKPFFYYMFKPGDFLRLFAFPAQSQFEDRAVLTLRNLLLVVGACALLFICLPLLLWQREGLSRKGSGRRILYFACLGLGYMLIEIGLMRRFVLFLGPPIYALAIVLFSLLVFSGLGSLVTDRIGRGSERSALLRVLLALLLLASLYVFGLGPILGPLLTLGEFWRCVVAVLLLAPLGLLMGMPMPLGLRLLHVDGRLVPWSWGINSATSVLGAIVAVILAMNFGFMVTLLCGMAVYASALLLIFTLNDKP